MILISCLQLQSDCPVTLVYICAHSDSEVVVLLVIFLCLSIFPHPASSLCLYNSLHSLASPSMSNLWKSSHIIRLFWNNIFTHLTLTDWTCISIVSAVTSPQKEEQRWLLLWVSTMCHIAAAVHRCTGASLLRLATAHTASGRLCPSVTSLPRSFVIIHLCAINPWTVGSRHATVRGDELQPLTHSLSLSERLGTGQCCCSHRSLCLQSLKPSSVFTHAHTFLVVKELLR